MKTDKEKCCGNCAHMQHEDANGIGVCDYDDDTVYCFEHCKLWESKEKEEKK